MVPKVLEPEVIQFFTIPYCLNDISMLGTLFDVHNTVHALGSSKSSDFHRGRAPPYCPLPDLSARGGSHHLHPHTLPAVTRNTAPVGSLAGHRASSTLLSACQIQALDSGLGSAGRSSRCGPPKVSASFPHSHDTLNKPLRGPACSHMAITGPQGGPPFNWQLCEAVLYSS